MPETDRTPFATAAARRVPRYTSYPTAPHFHGGVGPDSYASWLAALPEETALSLYVHVPFCDSLCWFCGCHTRIVRRYAPVEAYLETLLAEIDLVAAAIGRRQRVGHIHWGGGTPTTLSAGDIGRLAGRLRVRFDVASTAEFAVEIDPRGLPDETIAALGEVGVNRASIGVQDVNTEVQRAVNRIQPFEVTRRTVERLRAVGVRSINVDLMYGLPRQSEAHLAATVDAVAGLAPERLSLFGYAHLPGFKTHQRMIAESDLPSDEARWRQASGAAAQLKRLGYAPIGLDHFARPDDPLARALRDGTLRRNFQGYTVDGAQALVGLGASAIGSLPHGYVQNAVPVRSYRDAIAAGRLATLRGIAVDDDDRLRHHVIERLMCDLAVDLDAACRRHGRTADYFAPELRRLVALEREGIVEIDGARLRVPEESRPLIRLAAAVFDRFLDRSTSGAAPAHAKAV